MPQKIGLSNSKTRKKNALNKAKRLKEEEEADRSRVQVKVNNEIQDGAEDRRRRFGVRRQRDEEVKLGAELEIGAQLDNVGRLDGRGRRVDEATKFDDEDESDDDNFFKPTPEDVRDVIKKTRRRLTRREKAVIAGAVKKRKKKGESYAVIGRRFGVSRQTVCKVVKDYERHGADSFEPVKPPGRPVSASRRQLLDRVRATLNENPRQTVQKLAIKFDTWTRTMGRIVRQDLGLVALHRTLRHHIPNRGTRLERAKRCLKWFDENPNRIMLYSDEKWFTVEEHKNRQNDIFYSKSLAYAKATLPDDVRHTTRQQGAAKCHVFAVVSSDGHSFMHIYEQGITIDTWFHIITLEKVYEWIEATWGISPNSENAPVFTQDNAPCHSSFATQCTLDALWDKNFWDKTMWPPCSPEINPLDFSIWTEVDKAIKPRKLKSVKELEEALHREWPKVVSGEYVKKCCAKVPSILREIVNNQAFQID